MNGENILNTPALKKFGLFILRIVTNYFNYLIRRFKPYVESIVWWKGKIEQNKEVVLIVKTIKKKFEKVEKEVRKLHSYTVLCILEIPIGRGNKDYLNWLEKEIR